jgi:hypothetical protein
VVIPVLLLLLSKNLTTISPLEPPAAADGLDGPNEDCSVSCDMRRFVCESIAVEISGGSRMEGRVMGSDCCECEDVCVWDECEDAVGVYKDGRMGGK